MSNEEKLSDYSYGNVTRYYHYYGGSERELVNARESIFASVEDVKVVAWSSASDDGDKKGQDIVAKTAIPLSREICNVSRPLIAALDTPRLKDTCYACYAQNNTKSGIGLSRHFSDKTSQLELKRCMGCRTVKFCDSECQAEAWELYHKYECPIFEALHPRVLPNNVRAIIRFLLQHDNQALKPRTWDHVAKLESHIDEFRKSGGERWENLVLMAQGATEYSSTNVPFDNVLKLFCQLLINSMTLTTIWGDPIGLFLHPLLAKLNHRCEPNAYISMHHPGYTATDFKTSYRVSVVPLKPIRKGERIRMSYIDHNLDVHARRKELEQRYFFKCECSKCRKEWSGNNLAVAGAGIIEQGHIDSIRKKAVSMIESINKTTSINAQIEKLRYAIHIMHSAGDWPIDRHPYPEAQHKLILAYIDAKKYDYALSHAAIQHFDIDPLVYKDYDAHPTRVIHTYLLLKLMTPIMEGTEWHSQTLGLEKVNLNLEWWRAKLCKALSTQSASHWMPDTISINFQSEMSSAMGLDLDGAEANEKANAGMRKMMDAAYERNKTWPAQA